MARNLLTQLADAEAEAVAEQESESADGNRNIVIKRTLMLSLAAALGALGLIGLVIPILPGVLLLGVAALCASSALPALQEHLQRYPSWNRWHMQWRAGTGLPLLQRLRLAFWLTAEATVGPLKRR